ncbi:hypothetical protein DPMN_058065 [Dreissena polymorpha]|uniref:Uncharacterized protein n=1 Tax=Dreissena polymorpha TaxID=45954 RepID=A0A9D4C126_DREPO|nr:hypothetical protein DPMN_058065 [Dreissena polymorpha]
MQIIRSHTVALHLDGRLLLYRCSSYVFCVYVPGLRDPGTDTALFQPVHEFLHPEVSGLEGTEETCIAVKQSQ